MYISFASARPTFFTIQTAPNKNLGFFRQVNLLVDHMGQLICIYVQNRPHFLCQLTQKWPRPGGEGTREGEGEWVQGIFSVRIE